MAKNNIKIPAHLLKHPVHFLALGFGSGLATKAPGTWGTLAGIPVYLLLYPLPIWQYMAITIIAFLIGIYLCEQTSKALGVHDHSGIVWDEIVGLLITMTAIPLSWQTLLLGFLLFRFFDIIKPWPIQWLDQKVSGGFGIMIDDVLAGVFAWLGLYLLLNTGIL